MSEDPLAKLTRSPSGSLWPPRRPPLNKTANSSNNKSAKEDTINFLVKESNQNDSTDDEPELSHENKILDSLHLNDNDTTQQSENDSNYDNDNNESDESDSEYFEEESGYTENYKFASTPIHSKDIQDSSSHDSFTQKQTNETKNVKLMISPKVIVMGTLIFFFISVGITYSTWMEGISDLSKLKEEFPMQHEGLWINFESGVEDVIRFNRPSTFILLYKKEAENTLEKLLNGLTSYAACKIRDCRKKPIIITDAELNSSEIVDDYGKIIVKYKNELQDRGVMIIKNLENVPGVSAQAFHSFCDEITPLVDKSLFIFTMRVDKSEKQDKMKFVGDYFKNKWTDIKVDTFNALITRISSMVLEVKP